MKIIRSLQNRIYEIRGERVILDFDLARLYEVPTKALNLAVKLNLKRFPEDFMFRLTSLEFAGIKFQVDQVEAGNTLRSQIVAAKGRGGTTHLPCAFTEHGVLMLSGVLDSDMAINMNISLVRTFIEIERLAFQQTDTGSRSKKIKDRPGERDIRLNQIYEAVENLMDEKAAQRKWDDRERIGFKKNSEG